MNNISQQIEGQLVEFAKGLLELQEEATDLTKYYFSSGASNLVNALVEDTTPATQSSGLSKGRLIGGITLCEALKAFFGNQAVVTADRLDSAQKLIGGSFVASAPLSADVEAVGSRLKALGGKVVGLNKLSAEILKSYSVGQLSGVLGALSAGTVLLGCSTTKEKFLAGVVLVQQFDAALNNSAVVQGDYLTTVVNWAKGI